MPVSITQYDLAQVEPVELDTLANTVEKNRDRVRTTCGMLLSLAGILISFGSALLLFLVQRTTIQRSMTIVLVSAVIAFVVSAVLAIASSFLRTEYAISDKSQFLADLLQLYHSELRLLRYSAGAMICGLLLLAIEAVSFILFKVTII